ncbi:MAG: cytidylate kinase-like family protein [Oscillospiraceae bacterium]|jgi:cytidylate kinase|nr:cytidylate kinase-like family protein [Oscillospiraceae bacterium]
MSKFVIALSREYGSGGRDIGKQLAEELDIGSYDKSIIKLTAEKSGLAPGYVEESEEKVANNFLYNVQYSSSYPSIDSIVYYETPTNDKMFIAQSAVIRELADKESCVIIGRCADYVLRNAENLVRVFIRADITERAKRAVELYGLTEKNAEATVRKTDKSRANYYKYYTNRAWGAPENADIMINSTFTGVDGAVAIIKTMLKEKGLV